MRDWRGNEKKERKAIKREERGMGKGESFGTWC
jgi:hypothetical protein